MASTRLNDFLRENPPANQFVPYIHLSRESDSLTVYLEGDADYSERLSEHVTLYRSIDTKEVVGCRIKGISGILEDLPNYIAVRHDGIQLSLVFWAFRGQMDDSSTRDAINELARAASERNMMLQPSL